jgi:hypothetical protein
MSFNPAGTKWSVAAMDNNGAIAGFHPVPWQFHQQAMNAAAPWVGGYTPILGSLDGISCEIFAAGATSVSDSFQVFFVTADRFVATKNGALYRFGKKI